MSTTTRFIFIALAAGLALALGAGTSFAAIGEKKGLVCPVLFPKQKQMAVTEYPPAGVISESYKEYWEKWHLENSYGKYAFPTKTYQYVNMPWPKNPMPGVPNPVNESGSEESCPPPGGEEKYADGFFTPGERFLDLNGDGAWQDFEKFWDVDNTLLKDTSNPFYKIFKYNGYQDDYGEVFVDLNQNGVYDAAAVIDIYSLEKDMSDGVLDGRDKGLPANFTVKVDEFAPRRSLEVYLTSYAGTMTTDGNAHFGTSTLWTWDPKGTLNYTGDFYHKEYTPASGGGNHTVGAVTMDGNLTYVSWNCTYTPMASDDWAAFFMTAQTDGLAYQLVKTKGTVYCVSEKYEDSRPNGKWDDREPFEDFMVRWDYTFGTSGKWIPVDRTYAVQNYPGDGGAMYDARTGNLKYDERDPFKDKGDHHVQVIPPDPDSPISNQGPLFWDPKVAFPDPDGDVLTGGGPLTAFDGWWVETFGTASPGFDLTRWRHTLTPGRPDLSPGKDTGCMSPFTSTASGIVQPDASGSFYDSEREFRDMPSAMYHHSGDFRLGEETDPSGQSIDGADRGKNNPTKAFTDSTINCSGPLAYDIYGDHGFDAGNQFNIEFLTWRTKDSKCNDAFFSGLTSGNATNVGETGHKRCQDVDLDGLVDQGVTVPYGYNNYIVDNNKLTINDGSNTDYPFHRTRVVEDTLEVLDSIEDFQNFSATRGYLDYVMCIFPNGYGGRNFQGQSGMGGTCDTRDNPVNSKIGYGGQVYHMGAGGEGSNDAEEDPTTVFPVSGGYGQGVNAHEAGHDFHGWPDLYDYDSLNGLIVNNPIGSYDIMAGGGFTHSQPYMKLFAGWTDSQDLANILVPGKPQVIDMFPAEKTERQYYQWNRTASSGTKECYYFWYESCGSEKFSKTFCGPGLHICHGAPVTNRDTFIQQRLGDHFMFQMVNADGLNQMADGINGGDAGDPFPGSNMITKFNADVNPRSRWWDGVDTGIEILNISKPTDVTSPMKVTFLRKDYNIPEVTIVSPPGGKTTANPITNVVEYQIIYDAYDSFGGSTIYFFRDGDASGYDGTLLTAFIGKATGLVRNTFNLPIPGLADGNHYLYALAVPGPGEDNVMEASSSTPFAWQYNIGNGTLAVNSVTISNPPSKAVSSQQVWTVTCLGGTRGAEKWKVSGSVTGDEAAYAITGVTFTPAKDYTGCSFTITAGVSAFATDDKFYFRTAGLTAYSAPIQIVNGAVPVPPATPKITVTSITGNTSENGQSATFDVFLAQQPSSTVSLSVFSSDLTEGVVSPATLTFNPTNWNKHQVVTVTGVDDWAIDGDVAYEIFFSTPTSTDSYFANEKPENIRLKNIDNDSVTPSDLVWVSAISNSNLDEKSGTATFTVKLTQQPTDDVLIVFASEDTTEGTLSNNALTFSRGNWNVPQTVTVKGVDDTQVDGDVQFNIRCASVRSLDKLFDAIMIKPVTVITQDDDYVLAASGNLGSTAPVITTSTSASTPAVNTGTIVYPTGTPSAPGASGGCLLTSP